ncbi:hypothetical protein PI125_g13402 [Phytophthora idaei]|nr:hypothetical protein PI125_g13402 [Phytophthora idaei]
MTVPQLICEVVTAPELAVLSQAATTTLMRQYETKIAERCATTEEDDSVTDAMLLAEMKRMVGGMANDRVRDVSRLFANELKMDLGEVDVEARIAKYFMSFDRLVEVNGLSGMLGLDLSWLVELTHREAKVNDLVLHDLMIERETRQQQYYLMQSEMKQNSTLRSKEDASTVNKTQHRPGKQQPRTPSAPGGGRNASGLRKPPRDGCLVCKGPHCAETVRLQLQSRIRPPTK